MWLCLVDLFVFLIPFVSLVVGFSKLPGRSLRRRGTGRRRNLIAPVGGDLMDLAITSWPWLRLRGKGAALRAQHVHVAPSPVLIDRPYSRLPSSAGLWHADFVAAVLVDRRHGPIALRHLLNLRSDCSAPPDLDGRVHPVSVPINLRDNRPGSPMRLIIVVIVLLPARTFVVECPSPVMAVPVIAENER